MYNPTGNSPQRRMDQSMIPLQMTNLSWSSIQSDIIINGTNEINTLTNIKNTVLAIRRDFTRNPDPKITFNEVFKQDFQKRMLLIENQVSGLMKRKINYSVKDQNGQRTLDYTNLLNQKENQIVELEKKIQNIQHRLRTATARQNQLQNHIVAMNNQLRVKQQIIEQKHEMILSQIAFTNSIRQILKKIKRNVDLNKYKIAELQKLIYLDIILPDLSTLEIKSDLLLRSGASSRFKTYQQQSQSQQLNTRLIELFRQIQKIQTQTGQINEAQVQRILQGFLIGQKQTRLYQKCMIAVKRNNIDERYQRLRNNFAIAAGIYQENVQKLRKDNPDIRINLEKNLFQILQRQNVKAYQIETGAVFIDAYTEKTVQVPVQDARTKHLLHLFATQMKKFTQKYPQLLKQMDRKLCQFFQQQLIDLIQVDEVDRLVNIVKYVPQIVKVENVYAYSSQKSRKVQFHLRVLIKALLQQLQKIKQQTGITLQMDQGVIGMINQQIMGVVNVDDILKVFRVVTKIVEVQKIVQKIVERRVEVPIVVPICKQIEKIVQVQKIVEVERIVNIPLEIPIVKTQLVDKIVPVQHTIQKIVEVPTVVQRIVYITQQVPKIVEVQVFVDRIVQVEKIVQVERVVNHIQQQAEQIQVIVEKIVPVETIVQRIVQVPIIKQKIVEKIVQVVKVEIIEKIVEKAVPVIQYRKALEVNNHIQTIHKPVDRIIEKIVPVIKTIQRIVQVPQIIQKIVEVIKQRVEIREVEVIRQKLVKQQVIKQIQVVTKQIVEVVKQIPVQVERIIQIPVIHEVVKRVTEIVQKPIISQVTKTIIKQVYLRDPLIIHQPKIVQIQKIINHYIEVPKPVRYVQQKIVQIPRNVQRIKQVRVEIQKIIQKIVEVPKIIQVERIVQKIVVVPRVIQKVVEVPQIVQKIVIREVQKIVVREVQKKVQIPVIQQRIVQVEVIKNIYIQVEKAVDRFVDKLITVNNVQEKIVTHQVRIQNVVQVIRQVPRTINVDKIVPAYYQVVKPVEIQRPIIVPLEIPVPVQIVTQKCIPIRQIMQRIIQVPQFIQKIVQTKQENVRIQYIQKIIQKIVIDERIKQVQKIVPYINQVIKQIPVMVEKIITIESKVQQIITAQQIIQKIVQRSTTIPRIYQVQKIVPKLIEVPKIIQVDKVIPQIIRVNQYIQKIVERFVEVPRIIQRIRQIQVEKERIVQVNNTNRQIVEVDRIVQKIAILQQMKQVVKNVNHIEKVIKIVQLIQRVPVQIHLKEEILVQIPHILEKIVQKIVIMPQIVEVLKYVHEISESSDLLTVQNEQQFKHQQLKLIQVTKNLKPSLDNLIRELRILKSNVPLSGKVQQIELFLLELQKLIQFPKLIRIQPIGPIQKIVQKQHIVQVPVRDEHSLRKQISMSILVEKLILEIKRISNLTKVNIQLDDQIKMIFFAQLQASNRFIIEGQLKDRFNRFAKQVQRKFQSLGPWAKDHQLMINTILQERFKLAQIIQSANLEIERSKMEYQTAAMLLQQQSQSKRNCYQNLNKLKRIFSSYSSQKQSSIPQIQSFIEQVSRMQATQTLSTGPVQGQSLLRERRSNQLQIESYESKLRQNEATINKLTDNIREAHRKESGVYDSRISHQQDQYVKKLERQVSQLRTTKSILEAKADQSKISDSYKKQLMTLQSRNQLLQRENSQLRISLGNSDRQLRTLHTNERFLMRRDESHRVDQSSWNIQASLQGSLSPSQIRKVDQSMLSQSQYSSYQYGGQLGDMRQSPSAQFRLASQRESLGQGLMTPLQGQKYRSPDTTGMKFTQSVLRQESRSITEQSPQPHTLFTTPGSIKYEKEKQEKEKERKQEQSKKQYRYYYSPEDRRQ